MIPLTLGYCETHFRFGGISPSLLFRREPEIVVDCPARVIAGKPCPIMVLVNEIDQFPAEIESLELAIFSKGNAIKTVTFDLEQFAIDHPLKFKAKLFHCWIEPDQLIPGWNTIMAKVTAVVRGKRKTILSDNFPTASHDPLRVFVAHEPLPGTGRAIFGDMHAHSLHTHSPVEFGAPLETVSVMATAMGLDFAAIIDHSYDLECDIHNYRKRDKKLSNWNLQQRELTTNESFTLLVGEEISGRKGRGGVVHLGAIGHGSFVRGSGDGARIGYDRTAEPTLWEAAEQVVAEGGITFAAHPGERTSWFQALMLRRGNWELTDLTDAVTAFQGINGGFGKFWFVARKLWVKALLAGKRIPLVAGNDAHGDFNRYRAIGFPFVYVKENPQRFFGLARTGIYGDNRSKESIFEAVRSGKTFITDGPFLTISRRGISVVGEKIGSDDQIAVECESSAEFGAIRRLIVIAGFCSKIEEKVWVVRVEEQAYSLSQIIDPAVFADADYIRAEVETESGLRHFGSKAVTSAVWIGRNSCI